MGIISCNSNCIQWSFDYWLDSQQNIHQKIYLTLFIDAWANTLLTNYDIANCDVSVISLITNITVSKFCQQHDTFRFIMPKTNNSYMGQFTPWQMMRMLNVNEYLSVNISSNMVQLIKVNLPLAIYHMHWQNKRGNKVIQHKQFSCQVDSFIDVLCTFICQVKLLPHMPYMIYVISASEQIVYFNFITVKKSTVLLDNTNNIAQQCLICRQIELKI